MVMALSIWNDESGNMNWLDSARWGRCGGEGWIEPHVCEAPYMKGWGGGGGCGVMVWLRNRFYSFRLYSLLCISKEVGTYFGYITWSEPPVIYEVNGDKDRPLDGLQVASRMPVEMLPWYLFTRIT